MGGSSLLRDCPLLERVATRGGARGGAASGHGEDPHRLERGRRSMPIRTARLLEDAGVQAIAVHGRTKEQGYSGDGGLGRDRARSPRRAHPGDRQWRPHRRAGLRRAGSGTGVRGFMIGRAAMSAPWIFREIKHWQRDRRDPAAAEPGGAVGVHRAALPAGGRARGERSRTRSPPCARGSWPTRAACRRRSTCAGASRTSAPLLELEEIAEENLLAAQRCEPARWPRERNLSSFVMSHVRRNQDTRSETKSSSK